MKHIPNLLSIARIPLSVSLLFLSKKPALFLVMYLITGLTDVLDGFLARRYGWVTKRGAKLDGAADILFMLCLLAVVLGMWKQLSIESYVVAGLIAVAALKLVNLCFTRAKFKQWSTMHTLANKYTALPFFALVPVVVWTKAFPNALLLALLLTVLAANLEETLILARMKEYDADCKSVIQLNKKMRG
ncbi:MAG: CDP-alcohol phosphatidyltransferase family protein [Oscillospiraceae bacterium]|nr:CDP-alcohol phosphatidyltransferase family protein [Oscillospiraceae bacterium]